MNDGARIRIAGQGAQSAAGRGDLYLRVRVLPDSQFTREGTTLRTRVDVPLTTAVLGGEALVPTPDGRRLALRIPAGTPNGKTFQLRGQGMPALGQPDTRGDLYAEVNVALPTHLNAEQRRLFEAFARSSTKRPRRQAEKKRVVVDRQYVTHIVLRPYRAPTTYSEQEAIAASHLETGDAPLFPRSRSYCREETDGAITL